MSLDRHAADRRRFARLLGIDGELGCGMPIGARSNEAAETEEENDRDHQHESDDHPRHHERDPDRSTGEESATRSRDR